MRAHARRPVLAGALLASILLSGCGGDGARTPAETGGLEEPDEATAQCRAQWRDLLDDTTQARASVTGDSDPDAAAPPPSALTSRWSSVEGTVAYYAGIAEATDCRETLEEQRAEVEALEDFTESLHPFDVRLRAVELGIVAGAGPELPQGDGVPPRRRLERAVQTLRDDVATAVDDQGPAWQQAAVVDVGDAAAREQAVADLQLLSEESAAWRRCDQAARLLERVLPG